MNTKNPSLRGLLNIITKNILSQFIVTSYFDLSPDKKIALQFTIFKLIKTTISVNNKINDKELMEFITLLWKTNEQNENYELAAILKNICDNINVISGLPATKKIKTEKNKITDKE